MQIYLSCVASVIYSVAFSALATHRNESCKDYVYDAIREGDNRAVVVNRVTRDVSIQDKRLVSIDAIPEAFSGSYKDRRNKIFFCLAGPLDIVMPKSMPMKQWRYHGSSCKTVGNGGRDAIRVNCSSSRRYQTGTSFTYSFSRGILSFGNSPIGGTRGGFRLRGQSGLFSPGCNP
jgi:hypothetical protein